MVCLRSVLCLSVASLALACTVESESAGSGGGGAAAGASSGGSDSGSGGAETGGAGGETASAGGSSSTSGGPGLQATGSFMGEAIEIQCEPPSDISIGKQFLHQYPAGLFYLWSIRCRTEDLETQLWIDLGDPVSGTTYEQPAAGDQMNIALGDPYDIQPINWLAENLTEMTLTVEEVDDDAEVLVGSFKASWSDEGEKYGDIEGTFELRGLD